MHWLRVAYKADTKPVINTILEKYHLEAALMTKSGDTLGMVSTTLVHEMAKALLLLVADNMRRTMPTKAELQARVEILEKENASLKGMLARAEREIIRQIIARGATTSRYTRPSVPVDEVFLFVVGDFLVLRPSQMV
ncbi:hypothetical protein N2M54_07215 [Escherichia coli]|uniref:hypothetical protein n=1 Tax=Escherichia TaxID=561 RepID=UPI00033BE8BF|nr:MULTISPECIES: hypothetical protein [Escherichia]EOV48541.1 hypothetical protein A1SC_01966 [Escherichia sp. KTE52]MCZ4167622.1 hypothetical protein [Escherichia coli]